MKQKKWIVISFLIILVVTLTPGDGKIAGAQFDKLAHFLIFYLLSVSLSRYYSDDRKITLVLLYAILLGFATEWLQQFIPGRNMDFYDALADAFGVLGGYVFYQFCRDWVDRLLN